MDGIKYLSIRQYTLGIVKAVDGTRFAGPDQHVLGSSAAIVASALVFVGFARSSSAGSSAWTFPS